MDRYDDRTVPRSICENSISHTRSVARTKCLLTDHIVTWYSEALRKLTENVGGTCSEHHR